MIPKRDTVGNIRSSFLVRWIDSSDAELPSGGVNNPSRREVKSCHPVERFRRPLLTRAEEALMMIRHSC
jgi:hypothetical protein